MRQQDLEQLNKQAQKQIAAAADLEALAVIEQQYFGRKQGELTLLMKNLKDLPPADKKKIGPLANQVKIQLAQEIDRRRRELELNQINDSLQQDCLDITMPGREFAAGHLHPNSIIQYELEDVFKSLGFMILDGPELESDYYNFEALNVPKNHPARDMQDTFYIDSRTAGVKTGDQKLVLRTQTSAVQVRAMLKYGAPIRAVAPGRVFRSEATDPSHEHTFYQMEGLMVDKNISVANVISVMKTLLQGVLKRDVEVRLRPGFFPFVEPGFELDINCLICRGQGCSVCKQVGWLEIMPCGMVHPNVLKAGKIDPDKYSGFAFGLGLTRLVMMRYGIEDIRHLCSGDLRFLTQF